MNGKNSMCKYYYWHSFNMFIRMCHSNGFYYKSVDDGTYTTKEITDAFPVGTPITTYIRKEEKLNVKHLTSITLTDGGVGRVLEATDGFVVVCGNEKGIFDVLIFKTMEDVKKYEQSLKR